MLYSVISAIEEAAPPVGSRPGLGSSVMASTIESLRPCASAPAGRVASAASEAEWVRTLRRFIMVSNSRECFGMVWTARLNGHHPRHRAREARGDDRGRQPGDGRAAG